MKVAQENHVLLRVRNLLRKAEFLDRVNAGNPRTIRLTQQWVTEFHDIVNDDDLQVPGKAMWIKGVPPQMAESLWRWEGVLGRILEKQHVPKPS